MLPVKLATALVLAAASLSLAGTTITSNLPANTTIVNIDSHNDGSNGYNGDQSLWYQPFSYTTLPTLTVQPGTYTFRIVDPADASSLYPSLTSPQLSQIYTGWTYNSPWITNYLIFDSAAATNSSLHQIIYGASSLVGYYDPNGAQQAYNAAIQGGFYNKIRTGDAGNVAANPLTATYTFSSPETLLFVIPDPGVYDNNGGVSVLVSPALPGDANGDGIIDADDYSLLDRGDAKHLTGWSNGDFNADNNVDSFDYSIINDTYAQTHPSSPNPFSPIPEPTSLALLAIAVPLFTPRRRR